MLYWYEKTNYFTVSCLYICIVDVILSVCNLSDNFRYYQWIYSSPEASSPPKTRTYARVGNPSTSGRIITELIYCMINSVCKFKSIFVTNLVYGRSSGGLNAPSWTVNHLRVDDKSLPFINPEPSYDPEIYVKVLKLSIKFTSILHIKNVYNAKHSPAWLWNDNPSYNIFSPSFTQSRLNSFSWVTITMSSNILVTGTAGYM